MTGGRIAGRFAILATIGLIHVACDSVEIGRDQGQERTELPDSGGTATVVVDEVVRLSFVELAHAPDAAATVFRLPRGGWGVSSGLFGGVVQLFDSAGAAAGTFGRAGEGPGELGGSILGTTIGDELWVVDRGNGRLSVYSSELAFIDARPFPWRVFSIAPATQEGALYASGFFHPAGGNWSVGRFSLERAADVFGGSIPATSETPRVQMQYAVPTGTGEVWTVAGMGGHIDVLRMNDLATVGRFLLPEMARAEEIASRAEARRSQDPPQPQVIGITSDDDGVIWVVVGVADADWTADLDDDVDGIRSMFDTRILAIDSSTRAVVGQTLLDAVCLPAGRSLISCVHVLDQVIAVRRLRLQRR